MPRFKVLAFKAIPFMLIALASSAFAANIWYVEGVHGSDNNDCKERVQAPRLDCSDQNDSRRNEDKHLD